MIAALLAALTFVAPPSGPGAAEPFLFTTRNGVGLTWLQPVPNTDRHALLVSRYRNGKWDAPRTIVERNDLFVNWADFPSAVEDKNGVLYAHWLQKSGSGTYAYDVWMAIFRNDKWGKPFLLNRDGVKGEHGFVSLVPLPNGGVAATWLDGRKMSGDGGDMTIRYATIDANGAIKSEAELDARTCECCTTGMTVTASGPVIVYRDRYADETRDISYVRRGKNGWTKPKALHDDGWIIKGCPVNGPQIDAIGNRAVTAWFTAANEKQRVYAAFSGDGGATFGKPVTVDDGKPVGRVDVLLLDEKTALVTWLEQTASGAEIRARRVTRDGKVQPSTKVADSSTARAAGFPRMTRRGNEVWFTWTEQSATSKRIHVAREIAVR